MWGMGFTLDALVRVLLAYAIPIDSVPLVSTVQWLVVLGGLVSFRIAYITKHGPKSLSPPLAHLCAAPLQRRRPRLAAMSSPRGRRSSTACADVASIHSPASVCASSMRW